MQTATASNAVASTATASVVVAPTATADNAVTPTTTADNAVTPTATASKVVIPTATAKKAITLRRRRSRAKPKNQHKQRGWSTVEQDTFLHQYMPRYTKVQATRKFDEFWLTVDSDFNVKWPTDNIAERKKVRTMTSPTDYNDADMLSRICALGLITNPAKHLQKSMLTFLTSKHQTGKSYDTITKLIPSCITRNVYKTKWKVPGKMSLRPSKTGS